MSDPPKFRDGFERGLWIEYLDRGGIEHADKVLRAYQERDGRRGGDTVAAPVNMSLEPSPATEARDCETGRHEWVRDQLMDGPFRCVKCGAKRG